MEAAQRQQFAAREARWKCVRAWSDLTGEPKMAWYLVWELANWKPRTTMPISPQVIGEDQGSGDPTRTGKRLLKSLAKHGLIKIFDSTGPLWTIHLFDPLEVEKNVIVAPPEEFQSELFEEPATDTRIDEQPIAVPFSFSAGVAHDPPAQGTGREIRSAKIVGVKERDIGDPFPCVGGSRATPAAEKTTPGARPYRDPDALGLLEDKDQLIGSSFTAQVMPKIAERTQIVEERCRRIVEVILAAVEEKTFPRWIAEEIGRCIAMGAYSEGRLQSKLALLAKKRIEWADAFRRGEDKEGDTGMRRRNYFAKIIQLSFDDCGLRLYDSPKKPVPAGDSSDRIEQVPF